MSARAAVRRVDRVSDRDAGGGVKRRGEGTEDSGRLVAWSTVGECGGGRGYEETVVVGKAERIKSERTGARGVAFVDNGPSSTLRLSKKGSFT